MRGMQQVRARRWALALTVGAATLAACDRPPVDNPYLPLHKGRTWTYSLTSPQSAARTMQVSSLGTVELGGKTVTKERAQVGGDSRLLYIAVDDRGVYRHAAKSSEQAEPIIEAAPAYEAGFLARELTLQRGPLQGPGKLRAKSDRHWDQSDGRNARRLPS